MRRVVRAASPELLWSGDASSCSGESSYRELEDVYLQTQTKIWLGEVLQMRIHEETAIANLLADGELLFQVSKVVWKMLLKKRVDLKHSKIHIYERTSSGKSDGRYMPYPKVDSFLKVCQILGLTGIDLFSPSDVVEKKDVRRVCMCIRSLSKKSRLQNLDVPDFDKVTYTIAMPTDLVGGIRRNLEQSQCSSSSSNGYIQSMDSSELYRQRSICGDHARYYDSFSESDEAESAFMEPELESPLSNVAYDATYLSRVVRERSSDGNLVFDEHISELQSEFQLERRDGHKEGCNGLPSVSNDLCHSRAAKNDNGMLQKVDHNKSSYPEQRNNQAVSTFFGDTGFVMWPNLDSQSLIMGSFQSSALPFEDSPFNLDEPAVSAKDDNGTMLWSKRLNYSVSQCTPFDSYRNLDYATEAYMKAFKVHSSSSEEVSYNTGDNDSVTSECSVSTEEVSGKGCGYITKVRNRMSNFSNNTGSLDTVHDNIPTQVCTMHTEGNKNNGNSSCILKMHDSALVDHSTLSTNKTGLQAETPDLALLGVGSSAQSADSKNNDIKTAVEVKSLDEVVDTEVVSTPSLNAILDNTFEDTIETKNCTANGFFFSKTCWLKELELSDVNTDSSVSELVVSVPGVARNTDLYDTKANEDIRLLESEKKFFTADTDSMDWISASEIESIFLFDLGLLQSMFDTRELHSCVKTKILESVGYFSSTASEKQITPGILDDLQIDRDGYCVPKVDLDIMGSPFNSETMHIKSECLSYMTAPGTCDQNEGKCASPHNICPSHITGSLPYTVMPVKDVSAIALEVDADELVNASIVETECGDIFPRDLTSNDLSVGESKSYNRVPGSSQSGASTRYNMDDVENQLVSEECNSETNRAMEGTVAEQEDTCHYPCKKNNNPLVEVKELCEEQFERSSSEKSTTNILQCENCCNFRSEENDCGCDGCSISVPVEGLCSSFVEQCTGCRESNPTMPSKNEAPRILQQINASDDDTDLLMGNDSAEKNVSATLENDRVTETYGSETQEMTTGVDLSEICNQGPNVHDGTRSIVPGNVLDAPNQSVHDPAYGTHTVGKSQTDVILPCSKPEYMAGKDTSARKIVEPEIPVLPGVNDIRSVMEHKEEEPIDEGVKGIDVEFEMQTPMGCSSTGDKEGETSKPHPPVKKVLKSIAGGITLFGALFLLLHIKGKRDEEKNSRIPAPLQNRNSRSEQVEKGNNARLYPSDRLKF